MMARALFCGLKAAAVGALKSPGHYPSGWRSKRTGAPTVRRERPPGNEPLASAIFPDGEFSAVSNGLDFQAKDGPPVGVQWRRGIDA